MESSQIDPVPQQLLPMPLREVGVLMLKHYGLHEGLWDVALHINVSIGHMSLAPNNTAPGAMFTVPAVVLAPASVIGPLTLNAAEINPAK